MSTTAVRHLRPGDRVVAVNGSTIPARTVDHVDDRGSAWLVPLQGQGTTHRLYDDQHTVAVEPAPVVPARVAVRIVAGLRLVSQGEGRWATADGLSGVQRESGLTFCDEAHPVRLSASLIEAVKANPHNYPSKASWAVRIGAKGYLCPGQEDHTYPIWTAWHRTNWTDEQYDTMTDALAGLADAVRKADR